ncbi:MAG: heavy metal translocating P-type ATPase [Aquificaceae bacterium]
MPLPYKIKRLSRGKITVSSYLFRHPGLGKDTLERYFLGFNGVMKARCRKSSGSLSLEYNPDTFDLIEFINFLQNSSLELFLEELSKRNVKEEQTKKTNWLFFTLAGFVPYIFRSFLPNPLLSSITLSLSFPVFKKAFSSLKARRLDVHFLDSAAILTSALSGNPLTSHIMIFLLSVGDYMEDKIEKKAYSQIEKLLSYEEDNAWLVVDNGQGVRVKAKDLKREDLIVVYAGEKISADGRVEEGEALVNQASLTGEFNPVLKKVGDKVYAGTFVEDGKLYVRVEEVGSETVLAKIVNIIENSIKDPISIQEKAERLANRFVTPTLLLGCVSYLASGQTSRLTATLIMDYHTSIHLATPLSIMFHIAQAAKLGILIKSGSKLEALSRVDTIVMDKTGTLTVGRPRIVDIVSFDMEKDEVLLYGASLEQRITHPVARAFLTLANERGIELIPREDSKYHIGLGVEGYLNGVPFMLGSTRFMKKKRIKINQEIKDTVDKFHSESKSVLYLVKERKVVGLFTFTDPLREEAANVVKELEKRNKKVVLCTGDNDGVTKYIAAKLGIVEYYSRTFPEEKAQIVQRMRKEGRVVAFVGDGVNDSPALSSSDVGISLRGGTDIAIELADIVIGDNLWYLLDAIDIADKAMSKLRRIYQANAFTNTLGLLGSVLGLFSPSISTLINNGTTVLLGFYAIKK